MKFLNFILFGSFLVNFYNSAYSQVQPTPNFESKINATRSIILKSHPSLHLFQYDLEIHKNLYSLNCIVDLFILRLNPINLFYFDTDYVSAVRLTFL